MKVPKEPYQKKFNEIRIGRFDLAQVGREVWSFYKQQYLEFRKVVGPFEVNVSFLETKVTDMGFVRDISRVTNSDLRSQLGVEKKKYAHLQKQFYKVQKKLFNALWKPTKLTKKIKLVEKISTTTLTVVPNYNRQLAYRRPVIHTCGSGGQGTSNYSVPRNSNIGIAISCNCSVENTYKQFYTVDFVGTYHLATPSEVMDYICANSLAGNSKLIGEVEEKVNKTFESSREKIIRKQIKFPRRKKTSRTIKLEKAKTRNENCDFCCTMRKHVSFLDGAMPSAYIYTNYFEPYLDQKVSRHGMVMRGYPMDNEYKCISCEKIWTKKDFKEKSGGGSSVEKPLVYRLSFYSVPMVNDLIKVNTPVNGINSFKPDGSLLCAKCQKRVYVHTDLRGRNVICCFCSAKGPFA